MSDETEELPEIDESVTGGAEESGEAEAAIESNGDAADEDVLPDPDLGFVMDVPLELSVELGSTRMPVRDVLALTKGAVVELDRMSGEPADVYVNDRLIARGEIVTEDDRVGVRITEIIAVKSAAGAI